jgi:hypothetical protein
MAREDKTRPVDRTYAETRLSDARAFVQQADLSLQFVDGPRRNATAVSSAVLAGIAACDAACALALGMVSAGAHDQAVKLLNRVSGSSKAVSDLSKLMAIKTAAQYTGKSMAERQAADAITRAQRLIAFAESQLRR